MRCSKTKFLSLIACSLVLASCNDQPNSSILNVGFTEYHGASGPTPQVGLAFTADGEQPLNATFDVYVGVRKGFTELWESDLWECNPGYVKFAINRVIENVEGNELQSDYIILDDFPNDEKYPLTYEAIEGTTDGVISHYEEFVVNTFDFNTIDVLRGSIGFYLCYYDDVNSKEFEENVYLYGISWGGKLNFEKIDETIIFTK